MTKEQVLAFAFQPHEIARINSFYESYSNFNWTPEKDKFAQCTTEEQVRSVVAGLVSNYNKRKEMESKKLAKFNAMKAKQKQLQELCDEASKYGFTIDDIIKIVKDVFKAQHNAQIEAQIKELQAKMLE